MLHRVNILVMLFVVSGIRAEVACKPWQIVPFDVGMQKEQFPQALELATKVFGIDGERIYQFFNDRYDDFCKARLYPEKEVIIPKKIHHIWLGSPLPDSLRSFVESWHEKHGDGWQYYLWTDKEIAELGLYNQEFYDATDNYGAKSDIARWEILYRFGGVYIDIDQECLERFDELHYVCDFYIGVQPLDAYFVQLGIGVVGSAPGHPVLEHCIMTVKDDWSNKGAPSKTGPVHFTKSFLACAGYDGRIDVALPANYFYPLGALEKVINPAAWQAVGARAVHHWAKSWMPARYRDKRFHDIANHASTMSWND